MSRFYVPPESVKGDRIAIKGDEAHHILDVMRLKPLDKVVAFDGSGNEYVGFILETGRKSLTVEIVERRSPAAKARSSITLIQAIPKKERMDYIVEKATELGASRIIPVVTSRTVPAWDEHKRASHLARWRRIVKEAAKQCGRCDMPLVDEVKDFGSALINSSDYDLALIGALSDEAVSIASALASFKGGRIAVAIGPEGDFTKPEIDAAVKAYFKVVNLGPRVLRSDTAPLAALSIINYELSK